MMEDKLLQILKGAGRVFLTYGIRNVSMDDVSRELGISKKTLYQYVENKSDLLQKILEHHENIAGDLGESLVKEGKNAIEVLLIISQRVCLNMKEYKPSILFELQKFYPDIFKSYFEKKRQSISEGIHKNLELGIKEGLYREDLDIDLISQLYLQNLQDLHSLDVVNSGEVTFEKVFSTMFDGHIRGIVNQKGLELYEKLRNNINCRVDETLNG
ncbi:MAG: TetR/AcrR family transcriptional regulator [Bacteroidales bacterium]